MKRVEESIKEKARKLAVKIVEAEGLELFDIEFKKQGQRWMLRIYIDKESGVNLEDCERVSNQLSTELDVEDFIQYSYTLEVSSPGLDRPLLSEQHYRKYAGKKVKIRTYEPIGGQRNFKGRLIGFTDGIVSIEVDAAKNEKKKIMIPHGSIASARLEIEL